MQGYKDKNKKWISIRRMNTQRVPRYFVGANNIQLKLANFAEKIAGNEGYKKAMKLTVYEQGTIARRVTKSRKSIGKNNTNTKVEKD